MQERETTHITNDSSVMHKSEITRTERLEQVSEVNEMPALQKNDALTLDAGSGVHNVE